MLILTWPNTRYLDQSVEEEKNSWQASTKFIAEALLNRVNLERKKEKSPTPFSHQTAYILIIIYIMLEKTFFPRTIPEWNHLLKI